jgi:hypothetical protein
VSNEVQKIDEIIFMMNYLILLLIIRKETITDRHGMRLVK